MNKFDIFISYRRQGGAQFARIIQLMLQQRGYKVFLDYDELTDGVFSDHIKDAIREAPIFLLVLSKDSLSRCRYTDDWVRQEIQLAISLNKQLIPVNPDNSFDGIPDDIPDDIKNKVGSHQHSEISFGQTLGITIDYLIEKRIVPHIGKRESIGSSDTSFDEAKETLKRIDARNKTIKHISIITGIIAICLVIACCLLFWRHSIEKEEFAERKSSLEKTYQHFGLQFSPNVTSQQMESVDQILKKMAPVIPDTLWMSQFECTVSDWHGILGGEYDKDQPNMPMTDISQGECLMLFIDSLCNLTNICFDLPSAEEWKYAAKGGYKPDGTIYSGSNDIDKVAWYKENSQGIVHPSDGRQGKEPNSIDLFDMSGNVSEMCKSPIITDNGDILWTTCGGNINMSSESVTVDSYIGMDADSKDSVTGFRLMIRKS